MPPLSQDLVDLALATPGLEPAADALQTVVDGSYDALGPLKQPLKDALNGTWLGHPVHPPLTDVPIGAWTLALALDVLGERRAAKIAVGIGLLGAIAAIKTGATDWADIHNRRPRRLGIVHAALNVTATGLYGASWLMRGRRADRAAIALSTLGYGFVTLAALYGGTIALDLQVGVNYAHGTNPPPDEADAGLLIEVPDGGMRRVVVQGYPVLLARRGDDVHAISAICAHQGGPLEQGTLDGDVVTCPWHGSRFCVRDGALVNGPSAYPQPAFRVRVADGRVYVAAVEPL